MNAALALPDGRRGQILALGIALAGLLVIWLTVLAPLWGWYQQRGAELARERALAAHMAALAREIPALQAAVAAQESAQGSAQESAQGSAGGGGLLLEGGSDAIAGANLQSALQDLAAQAGAGLDSTALAPVQAEGALRKIGLEVSLTASWPALIGFLAAVETATPRLVVDGLSLSSAGPSGADGAPPVEASLTISGFRAVANP